jgi:hypothetical protein
LRDNSTPNAIASRITEIAGDTIANCSRPVVVSTSPLTRDRIPPVFISQMTGSGRCSKRSKSDRRSASITPVFRRRWR